MLTMIYGKICIVINYVSSSQVCYICGASSKQIYIIEIVVQRPVDHSALNIGISSLHAWIRFLVCILHEPYRLDFKLWQASGDNKQKLQIKKKKFKFYFKNV